MYKTAEEVEIMIRESRCKEEAYREVIHDMVEKVSEAFVYYYLLRGDANHYLLWETMEDFPCFNDSSAKERLGYGEICNSEVISMAMD